MSRLVGLASVTFEDLLPNIISKDEKDVRPIGCLNPDRRQYEKGKQGILHCLIQTRSRHRGVSFF